MKSFGHKMIISSQPVPLTGTGVLYPRVRDFFLQWTLITAIIVAFIIETLKKLENVSFLVSLFSNKGRLKKDTPKVWSLTWGSPPL